MNVMKYGYGARVKFDLVMPDDCELGRELMEEITHDVYYLINDKLKDLGNIDYEVNIDAYQEDIWEEDDPEYDE